MFDIKKETGMKPSTFVALPFAVRNSLRIVFGLPITEGNISGDIVLAVAPVSMSNLAVLPLMTA
jgi:hypothetical protein